MSTTDLAKYNNNWYPPTIGAPAWKRLLWYYTSLVFFESAWLPVSSFKRALLKAFGAKIGKGVVIKPRVQIKYPWLLTVGHFSWIGEGVWIDNLTTVQIGAHACLSQGAYLLTGNHNYSKPAFDLLVAPIILEEGVWIGAKAIVCPGITCFSHSVLTAGSIATRNLEAFTIYQGNPALAIKKRTISVL
ncbi:WcaF family extracellular polysaccharide biosynthesis acetyltransferase [Flavihumibacter sp. UBA7668]|uniref:WcaF family extracellular polysaccharide biosynthesis acetyltransferase n=1 Tax=Flavihumibacter sp. UBA7668 TaxID=1946542 RepID=UPI0025C52EF6|nr:WcaF family extracellular polysaccharide biosynthesis acetyltransferase [Flavihumibacter sp. UBA7668]